MSKLIDLAGQRFERLRVLGRTPHRGTNTTWDCLCDCGNRTVVLGFHLRGQRTRSCGCLQRERALKHGHCSNGQRSREYRAWHNAKSRCYCPRADGFKNYGGRGVSVHPAWRNDFTAFLRDMGKCPEGYTLDRIDVNGDYELGNCRWATRTEQARNRRSNRHLEHDGETLTITEWAIKLEMSQSTLAYRLKHGYTLAELIASPKMPQAA